MFDQVTTGEVTLENTGKVGFNFNGISGLGEDPTLPGAPILEPSSGYVPANSDICLNVHYLPGIPEKFHKTFEVSAAFAKLYRSFTRIFICFHLNLFQCFHHQPTV